MEKAEYIKKLANFYRELFRHEVLSDAEKEQQLPLRLAFLSLHTCFNGTWAFPWRPRQLKLDILPYDSVDFAKILEVLLRLGFIKRHEMQGDLVGVITITDSESLYSYDCGEKL